MVSLEELRSALPAKSLDELSFWLPIAQRGFRGFNAEEYRTAAIRYKQYGLIQIGRDVGFLKGKTVLELCCGPTPIVWKSGASRAIGVDPLSDVYGQLWDRSEDGVEYVASEIETMELDVLADVVICWNGIDHVRDIEITISKISKILRPEGELWVYTNTEDRSESITYVRNMNQGHQHQYFFNYVSLDRFFRAHGYRWVTKFAYEPIMGETYPYSGIGGVLMKWSNDSPSLLRDVIRAKARRVLYGNRVRPLWR
jgi:ubiquinone/menaquinone biosynthesis C-methylase UbiE